MKMIRTQRMLRIAACLLFLLAPLMAQAKAKTETAPPVGAPVVREGDFAVKLASALGLSTTGDEIEAESRLGDAGISPRNGWIADYPVTPDIISELQTSVGAAAEAKKISLGKDEALKTIDDVKASVGLAVTPAPEEGATSAAPSKAVAYPNQTVINNYYYDQGPPVVTYYEPPPAFSYLYVWVPSPFWFTGFWFPGFFVLHDFHRVVFEHGHIVRISNHFNDYNIHRAFRIDPDERYYGRTFIGIGAPHWFRPIPTGRRGSDHEIFNHRGGFGREHGREGGGMRHGGEEHGFPGGGSHGGGGGFGHGGGGHGGAGTSGHGHGR
jgi:hypothetical protein